jgi:GNAT superfamily N-acetyltransferase
MIKIRRGVKDDLHHLRDLDLKCYERPPADFTWWTQIADSHQCGVFVACDQETPIGMFVFEVVNFKAHGKSGFNLHIHKLCVRENYRHKGIGSDLMEEASKECKSRRCTAVTITVPEYRCLPKTYPDDDVSIWLARFNFEAISIMPEKLEMYGKEYDYYLFATTKSTP